MTIHEEHTTHVLPRLPTLVFAAVDVRCVDGPDRGKQARLEPGTTRVGTAAGCKLRLGDSSVSRVHCEVRVETDGVQITDCGSTNGTFVDGVEVNEARLASGSIVAIGTTRLRVDIGQESLSVTLSARERFGEVVGASAAMRRVYALMEMVASNESTVLIQGETGTGKEVVARAIHDESGRAEGPFVAVDCGAIAESVIESELFGHVRGAFTGAVSDRRGLFEEARGGTVFLDEIGELPLALQPKLLRALESREVRPIGSNATRRLDSRVIAATNRPLARSVNDGTFREDLYYRLAVFEIALPPLRARREDIPMLANHMYARLTGASEPLPEPLLATLMARSWPGNVRELRNFVERGAAMSLAYSQGVSATLEAPSAPMLEAFARADLPYKEARLSWISQFELAYVSELLRRTGGNVTRAAELAGVSRRYLHQLISQHRIRGVRGETEG
jgi:transcriptional regulator with GAF, ATPase, and Fis domain